MRRETADAPPTQGTPMYRAYYSSVLDHPATEVWSLVRDFDNYPRYIQGVTESVIEDHKRGDEVGAVRCFRYGGIWIRQRLTAHSDADRSFTYAGMEQFHFPIKEFADAPAAVDYQGTLRCTPIVDGDRTFVEWFVEFKSAPSGAVPWTNLLVELIAQWVDSLRRALAGAHHH
ncbi:SRPBCC family protein [Reyranella sp. CPCC 100927]|uniref:SRPBCC family protein n=1 Tax=Reyranella sp. CPCC 100927 TaxID=2599616 RepID=UPI002106601E|nr:SRPBCC family protein [Reyranella sp. CPCC 100927]